MREIYLVGEESSDTSLVFRNVDGEQYFLAVDNEVREVLSGFTTTPASDDSPDLKEEAVDSPELNDDTQESPVPDETSASVAAATTPEPVVERSLPTPDPLYSAPLTMRPREIQNRIRAGSSVEELAEEMGVAASRLESYAYPVLLERKQISDLARLSHPLREDGPAKLTLSEVLAAAFGARGYSLGDASWDAFKEPAGEWIIRVTWQAGLSTNEAEWVFHRAPTGTSGTATTQARNAIAADLTDPDFIQPVRSLTSISRGTRYQEAMPAHRRDEKKASTTDARGDAEPATADVAQLSNQADVPVSEGSTSGEDINTSDGVLEGEELLQNPSDDESQPAKRRRKAVTPHWEDVLLGVRANTKRPKQ